MAFLLKKAQRNTIKANLNKYMRMILGLAFLCLMFFFFFHWISVGQYQKNMDRVLTLNSFFNELDTNYRLLNSAAINGYKENLGVLEESARELERKVGTLVLVQINDVLTRDIQDISFMLKNYQGLEEEVRDVVAAGLADSFTPDLLEKLSTLGKEVEELYGLIAMQYKDIHLTLINAANVAQKRLNTCMMICYMGLGLITVSLLAFSTRRAAHLTGRIVEPIEELTGAANLVRQGNLEKYEDVVVRPEYYDEISILMTVFNMTIRQLETHIQVMEENSRTLQALHVKEVENLRVKELLKASELKALQMQMNPHFLFNTLNMIARMAELGDLDKTVLLVQKTAQLLRYNLDYSGRLVTLSREIEMLGNYVFLQEQRFGARIFFDFDLDERFHQIQVPSFILQPLVENAVVHGIGKDCKQHSIVIRTRYFPKDNCGWISVLDDGAGMAEKIRQSVFEKLDEDREQREKIGLANVDMRLKLLFGAAYKLDIFSAPEKGTEIRISLKLDMDRVQDDEN